MWLRSGDINGQTVQGHHFIMPNRITEYSQNHLAQSRCVQIHLWGVPVCKCLNISHLVTCFVETGTSSQEEYGAESLLQCFLGNDCETEIFKTFWGL